MFKLTSSNVVPVFFVAALVFKVGILDRTNTPPVVQASIVTTSQVASTEPKSDLIFISRDEKGESWEGAALRCQSMKGELTWVKHSGKSVAEKTCMVPPGC